MRTSLHDIHLSVRRISVLLVSVATLTAVLPTAARAQVEPPEAPDLATLPGTLDNNWCINLTYLNGTQVYKVGTSDTQASTTGTLFNGTITGMIPEAGRQSVVHPSTGSDSVLTSADPDSGNPPTLTLKDAIMTSDFNQFSYIKAGAEPTLRIKGESRTEIMSDLIYSLGTLTLTVADMQKIGRGILNGSPTGTGILTVHAQTSLSIGAISNFQNARMHLDGEIHTISKTGGLASKNSNTSPDAITFEGNTRVHLQAGALCTYVSGFIELDFDAASTDGRALSVAPAGDGEPATTFATDGTCWGYALPTAADTRYTASFDDERLYADRRYSGSSYKDGDYPLFRTDGAYCRYSGATATHPTSQPPGLSKDYGHSSARTGIGLSFDPVGGWYYDEKMFDGTVMINNSLSYTNIPTAIHTEGKATLTLDKVDFQLPMGMALTVTSGTVTFQSNTYNVLLSGTYAPRVGTRATRLISPPADLDNILALAAVKQTIHLEGGGTVKGLVQLAQPESLSGYIYLKPAGPARNPSSLTPNIIGMKSAATNYLLSFYLENQSTDLKQESYHSDDPEQTYLGTFPATHPDGLIGYTGLREITPVWIVIDRETAFNANMPGQWPRVTEKSVFMVGRIGESGVFPLVNGLELQSDGQIRFADNGALGLVAARFAHPLPNHNQQRATMLAAGNVDKLAGDAGTPYYVRTGYPDATDQA